MKITRKETTFEPITITIESEKELKELYVDLHEAHDHKDLEGVSEVIFKKLRRYFDPDYKIEENPFEQSSVLFGGLYGKTMKQLGTGPVTKESEIKAGDLVKVISEEDRSYNPIVMKRIGETFIVNNDSDEKSEYYESTDFYYYNKKHVQKV